MIELLFLLLPVAAYSGWAIGNRDGKKKRQSSEKGQDYVNGLNYLLSEKPDEAIESFLSILQIKQETVEINLALGNLFRRRGEVERAIKMHQNIVARPNLSHDHRSLAMLELGLDYLSAGLYDRAESIFLELLDNEKYRLESLRQLLVIYEKTKDWHRAIEISRSLNSRVDPKVNRTIYHFYCELAQEEWQKGNVKQGEAYLKKATQLDKAAARAHLMLAQMQGQKQQYRQAIKSFNAVLAAEPQLIVVFLPELTACYQALGNYKGYVQLLADLVELGAGMSVLLEYSEQLKESESPNQIHDRLVKAISKRPNLKGLQTLLVHFGQRLELEANENFILIRNILNQLISSKPSYSCNQCGFTSNTLYWHCPSCKNWDTIRPIIGVEGD